MRPWLVAAALALYVIGFAGAVLMESDDVEALALVPPVVLVAAARGIRWGALAGILRARSTSRLH